MCFLTATRGVFGDKPQFDDYDKRQTIFKTLKRAEDYAHNGFKSKSFLYCTTLYFLMSSRSEMERMAKKFNGKKQAAKAKRHDVEEDACEDDEDEGDDGEDGDEDGGDGEMPKLVDADGVGDEDESDGSDDQDDSEDEEAPPMGRKSSGRRKTAVPPLEPVKKGGKAPKKGGLEGKGKPPAHKAAPTATKTSQASASTSGKRAATTPIVSILKNPSRTVSSPHPNTQTSRKQKVSPPVDEADSDQDEVVEVSPPARTASSGRRKSQKGDDDDKSASASASGSKRKLTPVNTAARPTDADDDDGNPRPRKVWKDIL